jgi:hypothetical protein
VEQASLPRSGYRNYAGILRPAGGTEPGRNGSSDVLWHNDNGANAVWLMNNAGQVQQAAFFNGVSSDWHVAGTGDFNADGKDDVVWRNDGGATAVWTMDGANNPMSFPGGVPVQWTIQDDHYQLL